MPRLVGRSPRSIHQTVRLVCVGCGLAGFAFYVGARPPRATANGQRPAVAGVGPTAALDPLARFRVESRDTDWSLPLEEWLSITLESDLKKAVPAAREPQVECRTTTCRIRWKGWADDNLKVRMVIRALYHPFVTAQRSPNEIVCSFREDSETPLAAKKTIESLRERRARSIADLHSGRALDRLYGVAPERSARPDFIPSKNWPTR